MASLTPDHPVEKNPDIAYLYNTSISVIVIDSVIFFLFIVSTRMARHHSPVEVWFLMPVAYVGVVGIGIIGILIIQIGGIGQHTAYLMIHDPWTVTRWHKLQAAIEPIYMVCVTFPKIAFLVLYLGIFDDRLARTLAWLMVATLIIFFVCGCVTSFVICRPYAYNWDPTVDGTCGDVFGFFRWISIPSIVTDAFILLIPIPTIWRLNLSPSKKIGVTITFMMGSLGFITAIFRYLQVSTLGSSRDVMFTSVRSMLWTVVEPSAYFISSCLPRLRIIVKWAFDKAANKQRNEANTIGGGGGARDTTPTSSEYQLNSSNDTSEYQLNSSNDTSGFVKLDDLQDETCYSTNSKHVTGCAGSSSIA